LKDEPKDLKALSASARLNTFYNQTIAAGEICILFFLLTLFCS